MFFEKVVEVSWVRDA